MRQKSFGKLIIVVSYATTFLLGMYITMYDSTIRSIADGFLANAALMGVMIGMQHFGMIAPPFFIGAFSNWAGKKKVLMVSYLLLAAGALLVGLTHSLPAFLAAMFIIGTGYSVMEATASSVLSDEFPQHSRRHLNFSQVAFSAGALLAPLLTQWLNGVGVVFRYLYIGCAVLFVLVAFTHGFTHPRNDKGEAPERFNPLRVLSNVPLLFIALAIALYVGLEVTIAANLVSYFQAIRMEEYGLLALTLFWAAMVPSRFLAGVLKTSVKTIVTALSALVCAATLIAVLVPVLWVKLVCFTLAGFGSGPIWPLLMDVAGQRSRATTGPVLGIMMSFSGLGGALLPLLSGAVVNATNQSAAYFIGAAAAALIPVMYLISCRGPQETLPEPSAPGTPV